MLGRIRWVPELSRREFLAIQGSLQKLPPGTIWIKADNNQLFTISFSHSLVPLFISPSGDSATLGLCLAFSLCESAVSLSAVDMSKLHVCSGHYKEWSGDHYRL